MDGRISGVILAGGAGKRFKGLIKPKIVVDGTSIISRILSVIADLFDDIILVTDKQEEFDEFHSCMIISDEIPNTGPLGGIHAAMKNTSGKCLFVFAGDMPFLDKGIIIEMIRAYDPLKYDALVPRVGKNTEPLHSIYNTSLAESLEIFLKGDGDHAARDFINTLNVCYHELDATERTRKAFTNINSPSDLEPED